MPQEHKYHCWEDWIFPMTRELLRSKTEGSRAQQSHTGAMELREKWENVPLLWELLPTLMH